MAKKYKIKFVRLLTDDEEDKFLVQMDNMIAVAPDYGNPYWAEVDPEVLSLAKKIIKRPAIWTSSGQERLAACMTGGPAYLAPGQAAMRMGLKRRKALKYACRALNELGL